VRIRGTKTKRAAAVIPIVNAAGLSDYLKQAEGHLPCTWGRMSKELPELPPKTGKGARAPPELPKLESLKGANTDEGVASSRTSTGSLHPLHEAALGPKETGVIQMLELDEGDVVKKGQVLFRLDAAQFELAVAQAKAALAGAKVQLASAKLDYDRTKALKDRGSIAQDPLDQSKARLDSAEVGVEQAQAALGLAQKRLANMVVTSPIDGVVADRERRLHIVGDIRRPVRRVGIEPQILPQIVPEVRRDAFALRIGNEEYPVLLLEAGLAIVDG